MLCSLEEEGEVMFPTSSYHCPSVKITEAKVLIVAHTESSDFAMERNLHWMQSEKLNCRDLGAIV